MSPSLDWPREKGERLRSGGVRDAYCWHHYDHLLKLHYLLVPVLATLSLKTTLPGRFNKPHFKIHKFREIKWLAQGHRGIVGGVEISRQVKLEVPVLSPTYGPVASCNEYSIPSLIYLPDPPLKEWLINVLFHLLIILLKKIFFSIHGPSQAWVPFQGRICI